ncbi:hypothetical protein H2508_03140 [Parahaliea sp. F7430]|uniref:Uncharacterized protein n=1 Tax=Sediminihaliea albiluteola TaxID=2758564 RepID=A0A7W2YIH9_9GAMM|nr:hypothetical protein [Sediminihaliea albiluteola]MBA6412100.1 hypothetical protein [Sediminihaliea albiluteola]
MTYLLIAVIVGLALAPLSHFLPSRQQRKQANLRETAALQGMFVEFRNLPQLAKTQAKPDSRVIYYGFRLKASRSKAPRKGAWQRDEQGQWRPLGQRLAVPEALMQMPAEVLAASVDEGSCGIYWREAGEQSTVIQIREKLGAWAEQLQT